MTAKRHRTPCTRLTLRAITDLVRATWRGHESFDAATDFEWGGPAMYLYPAVTPKVHITGVKSMAMLLEALVDKKALPPGHYVVSVTAADLRASGDPSACDTSPALGTDTQPDSPT